MDKLQLSKHKANINQKLNEIGKCSSYNSMGGKHIIWTHFY